jgi:hypothetical protein
MVSEREQRQYALMRQRVDDLRTGRRDIGRVIDDLSALIWELQEVSDEWRNRLIDAWGGLEIPYAMALDAGGPLPSAADQAIAFALDDLDALLAECGDAT